MGKRGRDVGGGAGGGGARSSGGSGAGNAGSAARNDPRPPQGKPTPGPSKNPNGRPGAGMPPAQPQPSKQRRLMQQTSKNPAPAVPPATAASRAPAPMNKPAIPAGPVASPVPPPVTAKVAAPIVEAPPPAPVKAPAPPPVTPKVAAPIVGGAGHTSGAGSGEHSVKRQAAATGAGVPESAAPSGPQAPAAPPPPPAPPLLFEVGWEVCWQLGGIYTVLRSKADCMIDRWDDRYCLIGPYNPKTAALEFEERPSDGVIREALDRLRAQGIPCHFGRWLIPGRPRVILLDYRARYPHLDHDKYLLWKDHGISVEKNDGEVNDVVAFGFTVAEFFRELCAVTGAGGGQRTILAHFHEWMAGVACPRIAHNRIPVTTVFTTHATLLGRYLASNSPTFYDHLPFLKPDEEAARYQIWPKFAIERAAAHSATVFTTVSEVTAYEAEKLLGRRADVILPNGLNIQKFAAIHEFQNLHRQYKERIHQFVMGHFFPSYTFDLNNTLYVFTSGRYEYTNKGIDLFIEALWRLNNRMKTLPAMLPRPTVVAFIITRAPTRNINVAVLQNQALLDDLRNTCVDIQNEMGRRMFNSAAAGRIVSFQELMPDDAQVRLKRAIHAFRSHYQPTIVTHDLQDDAGDPTLRHIRHRGMFNGEDDPVKVVFHPEFVTAVSPLIGLDYPQFVRGCHLGIFPSYYEPWGYTPMEAIAMGIPAITTDLSGFGAYVQRHIPDAADNGCLVLNRRYHGFDQAADDMANYLFDFVRLNRRQRIELRNKTERLGELFDWSTLVRHYHQAHDLALERVGAVRPSGVGRMEVRMV
jgi:glycogen(starch) synthase